MKFRTSAPAVLVAAVIVVVAVLSIVSNLISHQMAASFEEAQFELLGQIVQSRFSDAENRALSAAEAMAAVPGVRKAFAARDRAALLALTKEAFAVQNEKYGINQGQFHLPPAVSFLRLHNPERFGDDLSAHRQIVLEVNQTHAIRKGMEITATSIGVFGTVPLQDDAGNPSGSFEMSLELGPLLEDLKKDHGFEVAVFIDEKLLRETATLLKGDIFTDQNRVGRYVKFYATHPELTHRVVTDADINFTESSHYVRDSAGLPYGVLLQPVFNYAKKQIGVLAVVKSFDATRSADKQAIVWQTLLGIAAIVLLTGVVLVVIRGMLLRPLGAVGQRLAALAGGQATDAAVPEPACDEIRQLSDSVERLRTRGAGPATDTGQAGGGSS